MAIFKSRRDGNWWIDYYFQGRRKREKIGPNKREAETVLGKRKAQIREGKFFDIRRNEKIKFEDFTKMYLESYSKPNKKSWQRDEASIKHLNSSFGGRYLYEITSLDMENYKRKRMEEKAMPGTIDKELQCLKHIFVKAKEWGKIKENPAVKVKLLRIDNTRLRYLEEEEIKKLVNACSEHLKPIVIVALLTGMRRGEVLGLKWRDIDFNQRVIYLLNTKNGEKRAVYMDEIVYTTLIGVKRREDSPYVFCKKDGKPYGNLRRSFANALEKAGIKDFHFHDLRHSYGSQLAMKGYPLQAIQKLMGHKSIRMTQRYAHLSPSYERGIVEDFGKKIGAILTPKEGSRRIQMDTYMDTKGNEGKFGKEATFLKDNSDKAF